MEFSFRNRIVIDITTTSKGSRDEVEKQHKEALLRALESSIAEHSPSAAPAPSAPPALDNRRQASLEAAEAKVVKVFDGEAADITGVDKKFPTLWCGGNSLVFNMITLTPEHSMLFKGVNGAVWKMTGEGIDVIRMLERMGFASDIANKAGFKWVETIRRA